MPANGKLARWPPLESQLLPASSAARLNRCPDAAEHQAAERGVDLRRRQPGPALEPPGEHAHKGANHELHGELPRDGAVVAGGRKLLAHDLRKDLAEFVDSDDAAAPA